MSKTRNAEVRGIAPVRIFAGGILGIATTLGLTFAAAIVMSQELLSLNASSWLGPVILMLSAFLCAWISATKNGKKLLSGLLGAVLYGCLLMIVGMLLFSVPMQPGRIAIFVGVLFAGGFAGAIVSGVTD